VYTPRQSNDRLLLGLKGSLNEYELDLLRQRSVGSAACQSPAWRTACGCTDRLHQTEEQLLEKEPGPSSTASHCVGVRKFLELGSVRQTLLWFLEQGLEMPARNELAETCWKRPSYGTVYRILTGPVYGGAYAYGKTEHTLHYEDGGATKALATQTSRAMAGADSKCP